MFSRNAVLESSLSESGYKAPGARKTGTTSAGIVFKVRVCIQCGPETATTTYIMIFLEICPDDFAVGETGEGCNTSSSTCYPCHFKDDL